MASFLDAPPLSAYTQDPEYVAAAKAAGDLLARYSGNPLKVSSRDDRRLLKRYAARMDAAADRARDAHDAFLREHGLLDSNE